MIINCKINQPDIIAQGKRWPTYLKCPWCPLSHLHLASSNYLHISFPSARWPVFPSRSAREGPGWGARAPGDKSGSPLGKLHLSSSKCRIYKDVSAIQPDCGHHNKFMSGCQSGALHYVRGSLAINLASRQAGFLRKETNLCGPNLLIPLWI